MSHFSPPRSTGTYRVYAHPWRDSNPGPLSSQSDARSQILVCHCYMVCFFSSQSALLILQLMWWSKKCWQRAIRSPTFYSRQSYDHMNNIAWPLRECNDKGGREVIFQNYTDVCMRVFKVLFSILKVNLKANKLWSTPRHVWILCLFNKLVSWSEFNKFLANSIQVGF